MKVPRLQLACARCGAWGELSNEDEDYVYAMPFTGVNRAGITFDMAFLLPQGWAKDDAGLVCPSCAGAPDA
jgi:hypothetical protein